MCDAQACGPFLHPRCLGRVIISRNYSRKYGPFAENACLEIWGGNITPGVMHICGPSTKSGNRRGVSVDTCKLRRNLAHWWMCRDEFQPGVTARNKHFSDAVHYVRHEYDHGRIRLVFVTTDKQRADGFTKPLESAAFHKWRRHIISAHPPI